mmetsp:Transcript_80050/g.183392  ORF Transcript_80050/g.183392 Transcript_80050/m.183392 type:complete len:214 (-) Transcript_80050:937-1578(-)
MVAVPRRRAPAGPRLRRQRERRKRPAALARRPGQRGLQYQHQADAQTAEAGFPRDPKFPRSRWQSHGTVTPPSASAHRGRHRRTPAGSHRQGRFLLALHRSAPVPPPNRLFQSLDKHLPPPLAETDRKPRASHQVPPKRRRLRRVSVVFWQLPSPWLRASPDSACRRLTQKDQQASLPGSSATTHPRRSSLEDALWLSENPQTGPPKQAQGLG